MSIHKNKNISKTTPLMRKVFGRWLTIQRNKIGISQAVLAEILGMRSWQGVAQVERGYTVLAEKYWKKLCAFLRRDYEPFKKMMVEYHIKSHIKEGEK